MCKDKKNMNEVIDDENIVTLTAEKSIIIIRAIIKIDRIGHKSYTTKHYNNY